MEDKELSDRVNVAMRVAQKDNYECLAGLAEELWGPSKTQPNLQATMLDIAEKLSKSPDKLANAVSIAVHIAKYADTKSSIEERAILLCEKICEDHFEAGSTVHAKLRTLLVMAGEVARELAQNSILETRMVGLWEKYIDTFSKPEDREMYIRISAVAHEATPDTMIGRMALKRWPDAVNAIPDEQWKIPAYVAVEMVKDRDSQWAKLAMTTCLEQINSIPDLLVREKAAMVTSKVAAVKVPGSELERLAITTWANVVAQFPDRDTRLKAATVAEKYAIPGSAFERLTRKMIQENRHPLAKLFFSPATIEDRTGEDTHIL